MPITQSRMIGLIEAGRDFQSALDKAIHEAEAIQDMVKAKSIDRGDAFGMLLGMLNKQFLMTEPYTSHATLIMEHNHFKKVARENARAKERLRQSRGTDGQSRVQRQGETDMEPYLTHRGPRPAYVLSEADKAHAKAYQEALAAQLERESRFAQGLDTEPGTEAPTGLPNSGEVSKVDWAKATLEAEDAAMSPDHIFSRGASHE